MAKPHPDGRCDGDGGVSVGGDRSGRRLQPLDDTEVATRSALLSIVDRPTRGANILDRLYVNTPCYSTVRVVESTVKSDHKAIVAYRDAIMYSFSR